MYINKKGKNQVDDNESSRVDSSSMLSENNTNINNTIKIGTQQQGRSPTNINRKQQDLDKSTLENGPEIMYIDCDENDRRNPMMDYPDGRQTAKAFGNGRSEAESANTDLNNNSRNSVLTNVRNDVGTNKDGNRIANKTIPLNFDPEREKSPKVINLDDSTYSANTRTLNQKRLNNVSNSIRNKKSNPNKGYSNTDINTPSQNTHKSNINNNNLINSNTNTNINNNSNQSSNLNTTKSEANNQIYLSDTNKANRRTLNHTNGNSNSSNGIIKKMSPNRNNDMNMDLSAQRDVNRMAALKRLSIFSEKNTPQTKSSIKPEFSVDTRENINSKYTTDLDKIMKYNKKQENFKKYNSSAIVANNPKEGRLYTTKTHTFSPLIQKELDDHKKAMKNMNKLSTILLKDKMPNTNTYSNNAGLGLKKNNTVRSTSNDFQEKTHKKNLSNSSSPSGKFIRVTMALLSSKGPNCEDRIITRQMRFEKGGVVDLAHSPVNRSAPKKNIEVKKTNLRSLRPTRPNTGRYTQKEENAVKVVQSWWRDILSRYKYVEKMSTLIQKNWRRYFVRKNLYYKLSVFFFYAYFFDKIEGLIRRHNILLGYEPLYNQNAEKYNAIKYLRKVIFIQRGFRFYRNLKKQNKAEVENANKANENDKKDNKDNNNVVNSGNAKSTLRKVVKVPKGKAYDNQNKNGPKANHRYGDENEEDNPEPSQPQKLLKNSKGLYNNEPTNDNNANKNNTTNKIDKDKDNSKDNNNKNDNEDYELVSASKEKELTDQLQKLRNKFLTNAIQNAIKKSTKRNLTPFVLKWVKNAAMGSNKTDAGRKLAATDIAKAIIKKKYDLFLGNLRKASERPNKQVALNRIANNLLGLFNNRKRLVFGNLKKNLPGIKNKISDEKLYKILGLLLKKTSAKILNRKLGDRLKYWKNAIAKKLQQEQEQSNLIANAPMKKKNMLQKQTDLDPTLSNDNEPFELVSQSPQKALKSLLTHLQAKFKNLNLPHFFNLWKNLLNEKKLTNLKNKVLVSALKNFDSRTKVRSLAKRFALWKAKASENRTVEQKVLLSEAKNQKLSAASKLLPALRNLLRSLAAKASKPAILGLVNDKNRKAALAKLLKLKPMFQKFSLQKYFDKLRNSVTEADKENMKVLLLKSYCRKLMEKSTSEILRKKLNFWWRNLPNANNDGLKSLQAVDKLKQALQKRNFQYPKDALKEKIEQGNQDWALMFIVEFKKKFLKRSIKEYVIRWRNNYLAEIVNSKMKDFYAKTLLQFRKRFCRKTLKKRMDQWRKAKDLINNANLVSSAQDFNTNLKDLYHRRLKTYYAQLMINLRINKKLKKQKAAQGILLKFYINRDLLMRGKAFRKWNKETIAGEVGELKANLISRILTALLNKHDGLKSIGKLNVYFNKWKTVTGKDVETINNLNKLIKRYLISSKFHDKFIRKNLDDLFEIATHINQLHKNQAQKIGDFMGAVLAIFKRIQIMKRQKALYEALHKLNFYEKMQIITASKRWLNKTALVSNQNKATVLQDFIRKIYQHKNQKAVVAQRAATSLDNFTKRFVLYKMSEAARLNKLISVVMKVFAYIPKELRKNYLRKTCSDWRQISQIIKKNNASSTIIKFLKGYIARKFVYKLKLKKHYLTEIVRRGLKKFVNEKLFYITEWARNAKMLSLKLNALLLGTWIPQKFNAFKKLKAYRVLTELLKKKEFNYIVGTMKTLGKTNKLVDSINNVAYKKNAQPLLKGLKQKYFRKKYSSVFADLGYKLRFCSVHYYADKWRNRVMDLQKLALIKIQAWVRMALQRLKAKRQLKRNRLMLRFLLKIHFDAKLAKQGYINLWRDTIKYAQIDNQVNTIIKFIKLRNEKMDYEKEIANMHLRKIFNNYLVTNIKYALVDCRNYKDSVVDVLKNLDSKIEKRYAINNLIDFGKDTIRNAFVEMITGKQDTLVKHNLIRQAVEKWRMYNEKLLYFVLKLQKMRRGKVFRDFFNKSKKIYDLLVLLTAKYLGDKPLKTVRMNQWLNRTKFFANKEKANVIQKFLKTHLTGILNKRLQQLFDKGFRNHFIQCIGQVSKFKQLKSSLVKPLNISAMQAIRKRFILLKIRDSLTELMGSATQENQKLHKEQFIKRWRKQIIKINEQEKFAALIIVASIKAKLMKLKIKKWQELSLKVKSLIYKAFGDEEGVKRCFVLHWIANSKRIALLESREALAKHAKYILGKINKNEITEKTKQMGNGINNVIDTIKKHIAKNLLEKISHNNKKNGLERMDEIYVETYKNNANEAIKRIKGYGFYRENLIKKLQRFWRYKYKLWKWLRQIHLMRKVIEYATDKELLQKHAYVVAWRSIIKKANDKKNANTLHQFYRDILNHQLKKKTGQQNKIQTLANKLNIKVNIFDIFKNLKTLMELKKIDNVIVRSHFNYFKFKSMILYILYILHGQFNKVEAKVKSTCVFKYRKIALAMRNKQAAGSIIRCIREINRRRHDNKIREILCRIAIGRSCDESEIKMRAAAQWCRNAFILKTQEKVKVMEDYLLKKKHAFDLGKKWLRLGLRIQGLNGIITSRLLFERIKMFRKAEPLMRFIKRHNIGKNGKDLLDGIKRKMIFLFIKKALGSICGIADSEKIKEHAKQWRLNCWKLQKREKQFEKASDAVQLKFYEIGFRAVVGAHDFKRFSGLAQLVKKFDVIRRLRAKTQAMEKVHQFTEKLVEAQEEHISLGSEKFADKIYKFYVYKLLANMGAIFLKHRNINYKPVLFKEFINNLIEKCAEKSSDNYDQTLTAKRKPKTIKTVSNHVQISPEEKKQIDLLGKEGKDHVGKSMCLFIPLFKKLAKKRKHELMDKLLTMNLLGKLKGIVNKQKKNLFDKLSETVKNSVVRANMFVMLRKIYLNKKMKEIESANRYLIVNHLVKLAVISKTKLDSRFMLKYIRIWKFNNQSGKIREEKINQLKQTIDKFSDEIKYNLFIGPDNITNKFNDFNNSVGIYNNPRAGTMKTLSQKASNDFRDKKSMRNKPLTDRADTLLMSSANPKLNRHVTSRLDYTEEAKDKNRETIALGQKAKIRFEKTAEGGI